MTDQSGNPYFRALWNHCSAKQGAVEDHPWGDTVFKISGKVFAFLGSSDRGAVALMVDPSQIDGLLALPFVQRSPYIGRYGWLVITIADDDALALALELVDTSYETIAAKSKGRQKATHRKEGGQKKPTKRKSS